MEEKQSFSQHLFNLLKEQVFDILSFLRKEIFPSFQDSFRSVYSNTWLLFVLIIGFGIRGYYLYQPMRYDESVTFLSFVNGNLQSLFYYPYPNNHVLHTLLVKLVTLILGANPVSIRLTAFLAGIGCIPLLFSLCRQLKQSGIFASLAISIFPYLIFYSTNARGYTLLVLLTLLLAYVGLKAVKTPSSAGAILISLIASLGMLTMPSMLFPIAGLYIWLAILVLVNEKDLKIVFHKFIIPCGLFTVIFSLVLYIPVIIASNGIETIINNMYIKPQPWSEFISQLSPHITSTLSDFFRDIPRFLIFFLMLLVLVGVFDYIKKRDLAALLLLPSILLGSASLFLLQHRIPFERTWIFMIPFLILVADAGFTFIVEHLSPRVNIYIMLVTFLATMIFARSLISSNTIAMYPDTGIFSEAPIAAKFLKTKIRNPKKNFVFTSKTPATEPILFYLWYYGVPIEFADDDSSHGNTVYIVEKSHYSLKDMTDKPVIEIFTVDDMEVYQGVDTK